MFSSTSSTVMPGPVTLGWSEWLGTAGISSGLAPHWATVPAVLGATCAVAITIRLMDDFLDAQVDAKLGIDTYAVELREAALPYALASFAMGAMLAPQVVIALFLGAYAVGMNADLHRPLPLHMSAWVEALLALVFGALGTGFWCMVWATVFMVALQAWDDLLDMRQDAQAGVRNMCSRFGVGETFLVGTISLLESILLSPLLTMTGIGALLFIMALMPRMRVTGWSTNV